MTKTQIQVPEELFQAVKAFAKSREWSLAETFRRGAELLLEVYAMKPLPPGISWSPPVSTKVGWKGLSPEQLRDLAFQDAEPTLSA
ncbi:MAG: hypothetical protein WC003_01930 [Terrimicrobiaceae bacterium]